MMTNVAFIVADISYGYLRRSPTMLPNKHPAAMLTLTEFDEKDT